MDVDRRCRSSRTLRFAALGVTTMLVIACTGQSPGAPSTPRPSPTAILVSPSASATVATPSPTPLPSATPEPSKTITTGRWVASGEVGPDEAGRWLDITEVVALADGRALSIGQVGHDSTDARMATEIWEPAKGWRPTTALPKMRTQFASVTLADGRVLVAGGFNHKGSSYSSAYIFDPATETWSKTGLMTVARTDPGIALLRDGRVLVVGGFFYAPERSSGSANGVLASLASPTSDAVPVRGASFYDIEAPPPFGHAWATAELFDPATGEWTPTGSMRFARSGPEVVTLSDGRVLVVGASQENVGVDERAFDTAELYDAATGRFTSMGAFPGVDNAAISRLGVDLPTTEMAPLPGATGSLVALADGGAVVVGNAMFWKHAALLDRSLRLDRPDRAWHEIGWPYAATTNLVGEAVTKTVSRRDVVATTLRDGSVLIAGGVQGANLNPTRRVERYDPKTGAWSRFPKLPEARSGPMAARLADGSVLLVGGATSSGSVPRTTYRFVPSG